MFLRRLYRCAALPRIVIKRRQLFWDGSRCLAGRPQPGISAGRWEPSKTLPSLGSFCPNWSPRLSDFGRCAMIVLFNPSTALTVSPGCCGASRAALYFTGPAASINWRGKKSIARPRQQSEKRNLAIIIVEERHSSVDAIRRRIKYPDRRHFDYVFF